MKRRKKNTGDPKVAIGYCRVSTDEQQLGPIAQKDAMQAWAAGRGVHLVAIHEDLGVSGGAELDRCPGLLAALGAVQDHGAGLLLVAKRDRLARDVVKAAMVESLAKRAGARVVSADGVGDGDDPAAQLLRTMVDAFAQYERAVIRSRVRAALAVKKARGERVGNVPYGYQVAADGKRLEPNPAEQTVLVEVRRLRDEGQSLREVARTLADRGIRTRAGGRWHPPLLSRLAR